MSSSRGCSSWVPSHVEERNQQISITQNTETTTINLDGQSYVVSNPISDEILSRETRSSILNVPTTADSSIMTRYGKTVVWTGENTIRNNSTNSTGLYSDIQLLAYTAQSSPVPTKFITGNLVAVLPVQINISWDPTGTSLIRTVAASAKVYSSPNLYEMVIKNWAGSQWTPLLQGQYAQISFNVTWTL